MTKITSDPTLIVVDCKQFNKNILEKQAKNFYVHINLEVFSIIGIKSFYRLPFRKRFKTLS